MHNRLLSLLAHHLHLPLQVLLEINGVLLGVYVDHPFLIIHEPLYDREHLLFVHLFHLMDGSVCLLDTLLESGRLGEVVQELDGLLLGLSALVTLQSVDDVRILCHRSYNIYEMGLNELI